MITIALWQFEGINLPAQAAGLTLYEFYHLRKASQLKDIDYDYNLHKLAFYMQQVQATKDHPNPPKENPKEKPKPQIAVYESLDDFYDYDGIIKSVQQGVPYKPKEQEKQAQKKQGLDKLADMLAQRNKN